MIGDYPYDAARTPPAPVLPLAVMPPVGTDAVALRALVDCGADLTVLPAGTAARVRLPRIGALTVRGISGKTVRVPLYAARLRMSGAEVVVEAAELGAEALVGRDVLNGWVVTLDGPARRTRIGLPPTATLSQRNVTLGRMP
ncbi:MAG: hypothetical protein QN163_01345 [Armatimonadota bacterium]|nr:hypothetical protein [Armatimonadota bacterium]MDR5696525.1 hypothetical protein [Armatimonadota bacterium]